MDFSATSSDLALGPAMAASMANSTQFAQTLATSINGVTMAEITAGRRQLSVMATITALDQQTPALETTIEFTITLPTTSNVSADSVVATTSDPAALASVANSAKASDLIADVNASSITGGHCVARVLVPWLMRYLITMCAQRRLHRQRSRSLHRAPHPTSGLLRRVTWR